MLDQQAHEADLFASIVEHHLWVCGLAAKTVWCHHHRQIVGIHLCNGSSLSKANFTKMYTTFFIHHTTRNTAQQSFTVTSFLC